jgi:hypothetical protein
LRRWRDTCLEGTGVMELTPSPATNEAFINLLTSFAFFSF